MDLCAIRMAMNMRQIALPEKRLRSLDSGLRILKHWADRFDRTGIPEETEDAGCGAEQGEF